MANITPPPRLRGIWQLNAPFAVVPDTIYMAEAVRTIDEMLGLNVNILERVYTPVGLTKVEYESDVLNNAMIITLTAPGQKTVYVPSTYIASMPDDTAIAYDYVVLSIPLGAVPSSLVNSLQQTMDEVKSTVSDLIGIEPTVSINVAPSVGTVTAEQHRVNEQNRLNAIKRRTTEHAQLIASEAENERLRTIIADYEQRLTANKA
jgi:hypothetical protein